MPDRFPQSSPPWQFSPQDMAVMAGWLWRRGAATMPCWVSATMAPSGWESPRRKFRKATYGRSFQLRAKEGLSCWISMDSHISSPLEFGRLCGLSPLCRPGLLNPGRFLAVGSHRSRRPVSRTKWTRCIQRSRPNTPFIELSL